MFYRYDADDLMYEVVDSRGDIICKTGTEEEAKQIIKRIKGETA